MYDNDNVSTALSLANIPVGASCQILARVRNIKKVVSGDYGDVNKDEAIRLAKLHDILFLYEIKALKDSEYAAGILDSAVNIVDVIKDQVQSMGMPIADVDYLDSHIEKIKDAAKGVEETKGAPKGHYFTKSGNLVKGRLTQAAREKGARLSDPKDKQRSKVPPVTQYNEGAGDDHHYIKVPRAEFKKAEAIIAKNIDGNNVKMDYVDNDGAGNVIIYFMFKDGDIASGEANSFMHDAVMDLEAYGIMVPDHSAEMDEGDGMTTKIKPSEGDPTNMAYTDKVNEELSDDQRDALEELERILDKASELGGEARDIVAQSFPNYLSQGDAYGAFNFGDSSNSYDTTLSSIVQNIYDGDEDMDEGVAKTKKAHDLVVNKMKELAKKYRAGEKSVIDQLKDLIAKNANAWDSV